MKLLSIVTILALIGLISLVSAEITPNFPGTQPVIIDGSSISAPPPPGQNVSYEVKTLIDAFSVDSTPLVSILQAPAPPTVTLTQVTTDQGVLGGERDIILNVLTGPTGRVTTVAVTDNQLSIACPNGSNATVIVQYDGNDGSSDLSLNPGLGGIDLTFNNAVGFFITASSDIQTNFAITVYSGNGRSGTVNNFVAGDPTITTDYIIPFSNYTGGVDFTDIVAIELRIDGNANVDFFLETFVTFGEIVGQVGSSEITGRVRPCDTNYYRIQTLSGLSAGNYVVISMNQTGESSHPDSLGTLYVSSSSYTDLQQELATNENIVDTLGQLPSADNYIYKCSGASCVIEISSCKLEDTTYYLGFAGSCEGYVDYNITVYLKEAPIFELFPQTPQPVFLDERPPQPTDNTLYYRYYEVDIPESLYSEGTYLVVNISRIVPFYRAIELSLNYGGLPESPENTGVIGQVDYDSEGKQVDNCIYPYCVDTARNVNYPYYENPTWWQDRIPCSCEPQIQLFGNGPSYQQTCNITVDPCNFQYGKWYISVLLPDYPNSDNVTYLNYTITTYVVQPTINTLFRNVTTKGAVTTERMTHYKLDVPASDIIAGESHLFVQISNVRNGFVDIWVHDGNGNTNNNLAGGPEACKPANATCHTRDACNVVIEKCHFTSGTWYIGVSIGYVGAQSEVFEVNRLPITYTLRANWEEDPTPTTLLAGVPAFGGIGASLYDFYVIDIPPTVDTWLFIELYSRCQDTEVILSVLHGSLPGGECYARPDFYCLTGDSRDTTYTTTPPTNLLVRPVQRQSCTFMIQTCELQAGPLYFSVYGHHKNYNVYGDDTFYQIPSMYTLYVDFDTAAPLLNSVSYSDSVVNYQYQHYYIRADQVKQGSYLTVEVTNIQHGVPQTIEAFVNYNYLAGNCPCYDHLYNCTGALRYGYPATVAETTPNFIPAPECLDTCCTILVPPSDFRSGVWYVSVLGVNQDLTQFTTPIGYTLTVTIHDAPAFIPLMLGQAEVATVPQWNKTLEYTHLKLAAAPVPLNDLVLKITYVQNCEYQEKHDNLRDTLSFYVNTQGPATELGYEYTCNAKIQSESYCLIVIPHCEWTSNDVFMSIQGNYDADFPGRVTVRAYLEEVRDYELTDGVYASDRVCEGTYKHFFIESNGDPNQVLVIDIYTNQNQDPVSMYLNLNGRASGSNNCYSFMDSCTDAKSCSFQVDGPEIAAGRYYVSVGGNHEQWYDSCVEFTIVAKFISFAVALQNGNPYTNHIIVDEVQHYRYSTSRTSMGDYLTIEVENVDFGAVAVYYNYDTAAGRCPHYLNEYSCNADSDATEWCEIRVPSCEFVEGDHYISVVGLRNNAPCTAEAHKIGYSIEVNQISSNIKNPEVDVGRDTTNTLVFEFLANNRYNHYQFRYTEDDYKNGYHVFVEITNVRDGSLYVYYNKGMVSDSADTSCQLAQICTNGLYPGDLTDYCYWQIPFCLSKPSVDSDGNLLDQFITVEAVTGRLEASYSILIWKQPPPSIVADPTFTLDNTNSSFFFPAGTELNVTHYSQVQPYGSAQFIKLVNVTPEVDGDMLEVFFYRVTNNVQQPVDFYVYLFPNVPAGAHGCCDYTDPSNLGSCEDAPCLRHVEATTESTSQPEMPSTLCTFGANGGVGFDTEDPIDPFYGYRCTVRVWPCEFGRFCQNTSTWWLSVVPVNPVPGYFVSPLPGLSYSVQWRTRNIRLNEQFNVDSISLNKYINTYNFTDAIPVKANTTEEEGWLSLYIDVEPSSTSRISIQTNFINGTSAVYISPNTFASPPFDQCNYYYCSTNDPNLNCETTGRFISDECNANLVSRYYITVRNLSGRDTISLVSFRIIKIDQPAIIEIPDHLSPTNVFEANSTIFTPWNITGVEGENYDLYVMAIDDVDINDHQSLLIDVTRPTNDAGSLTLYVRYGYQAGEYDTFNHEFYPDPESCYSWLYKCDLPTANSRCTLQIPHTELIQGYWYISLYNPDFLFSGVSSDLPDYTLIVEMTAPPVPLTINETVVVLQNTTTVEFPGTYVNYVLNLTAEDIGFFGGVTNGNYYSGDYYTTYLRIVLEGFNGDVTLYVNYDDVAGVKTASYNPNGYYQQSLTYIGHTVCNENPAYCYVDVLPCVTSSEGSQAYDREFKLVSGYYYVSLLVETATSYNLTAYVLTNQYEILTPVTINGEGTRAGTTNFLWSHTVLQTELDIAGDGDGHYLYTLETTDAATSDDVDDGNYYFLNLTLPGYNSVSTDTITVKMWRDDCTEFICTAPLTTTYGTYLYCGYDAVTLTPCSIKGGRFYISVYNPESLNFTVNFYQNQTVVQDILNYQEIVEVIDPHEYQSYFYEAVDVLEGATLTVRVCSACGEVEAWIRPSLPAGPGSPNPLNSEACGIDYCRSENLGTCELTDDNDSQYCCEMFLDTAQFTQQGYYITVRGVGTTFPTLYNENLYIPAVYSIEVIQTTIQIHEIDFVCPAPIVYNVSPNLIPQQFAIDVESANVGAMLRFTLSLPPQLQTSGTDSVNYAALYVAQNHTVGYTTATENLPYSCVIASSQSSLKCDFVINSADVSILTGRYYIWANAPRGSSVIVERWDPYIPIVSTNLLYSATINGPTPGYIFDGPFRPNTQYYRVDFPFDDDVDSFDQTFFARVIFKDVKHGSISAFVNNGFYPMNTTTSAAHPAPTFLNNWSCAIATDGYDCHIDIQYCDLFPEGCYSDDGDGESLELDEHLRPYKTFFITVTGEQQLAELHSIEYSMIVQTNWVFTYFPLGHTICNSVEEDQYNFHRLRPHGQEIPQQSILRISISDIDVVDGEEVAFFLKDGFVPTVDCYDLGYRSGRAESLNSALGYGEINIDWVCSYDNLYMSVYGINSADAEIDYKMRVEAVPVKVKMLFNENVYHADDDDDDACGSNRDNDQNWDYDYYIFKPVAPFDPTTAFLRVAVDSDYPFEVYLNRDGFAGPECHIAHGTADSGTVNLYDFCTYEDGSYFITVMSQGPYYIFTHVRDDAKELTLGQVFRDSVEQGEYQMYTLDVCKDWFAPDDRLIIEIADVQNGGIYGWIQKDSNPGPYQSPCGDGTCDIPYSSAFAGYGPGETGYDYLLVDHSKFEAGKYHILIRGQPRERDGDDDDTDVNPQDISFRLLPRIHDLHIDPIEVVQNTISTQQVVDYYTIGRNNHPVPPRTAYYAIVPHVNGYENYVAFSQIRLANVQGGLLNLRVSCGHLSTPPYGYTTASITALTKEYSYPGMIQSGHRPYTYQRIVDGLDSSAIQPECTGTADFCASMGFADQAIYHTDGSVAIWIPSCAFNLGFNLYVSVEAAYQYYEDNSIYYDLVAEQYADYVLLPPNSAIEEQFDGNWEYHYYRSLQADVQSARWRIVVEDGEGVLVTVHNNRCPRQSTWTREIWCDARYYGQPSTCDIEIPTEAAHPGNNAFFISVMGKNATYQIAYFRGLENCHLFKHNGVNDGLSFCSGIVDYPTWRWDDYANLDAEASCFFNELYEHFRVQPCWSGVTTDCNSTLRQFACYESFKACDQNGFYVGTCRSSCDAVVYECVNWFESVDLEHYNCSSSRYINDAASTCTGSQAFAQFDENTQLFFGGNPEDILYDPIRVVSSASSLVFSFILFLAVLLF